MKESARAVLDKNLLAAGPDVSDCKTQYLICVSTATGFQLPKNIKASRSQSTIPACQIADFTSSTAINFMLYCSTKLRR